MRNIIDEFNATMIEAGKSANTAKNYTADVSKYGRHLEGGTPGGAYSKNGHTVQKSIVQNFESRSQASDNKSDKGSEAPSPLWDAESVAIIEADTKAIREFIKSEAGAGLSPQTTNRRIQSIKAMYAFLIASGVIDHNPAEALRQAKIAHQNTTKWLQPHQVKEIFKALEKTCKNPKKLAFQRAIFSVLVNTGLRAQEVCDIRVEDIMWDRGLMSVVGKGNKFRFVPINPATQRNIKEWMSHRIEGEFLFHTERSGHMTVRAIEHMANVVAPYLTFSFTVHQLRHTALKRVADTTGKIEIVASVAGHNSIQTSRRYIEPSLQEIGDAMKATEFDY